MSQLAWVLRALLPITCTGCVTVLEAPNRSTDPTDPSATPKPACTGAPRAKAFPGFAPKPGGVAPDGVCGVVFTAGGQTDFGTGETGEVGSFAVVRTDASGGTRWARHFAHDATLDPPFVAVDSQGDIVIAGIAGSPLDLGGGEIESIGSADVYVAKLDPEGELVWARRFGGPKGNHDRHELYGLAVGPSGEVLLSGLYAASIDFELGPLSAPDSILAGYVVKLDGSGKPIWQKAFVPAGDEFENAGIGGVAVGSSGEVVIAGWFTGDIDAGTGPLTTMSTYVPTFVASYDGDGKPRWSRAFSGQGEAIPHAVVIDAAGDVIVDGRMNSSLVVDGFTAAGPSAWSGGGYVFKLDGSGKGLFASYLDGGEPSGLAVDADRNILVVTDGVTKLDANGAVVWTRGGGNSALWSFHHDAVAVDASGNALVTGVAQSTLDFGVVGAEVDGSLGASFAADLGP